jgi:hypothetical protein
VRIGSGGQFSDSSRHLRAKCFEICTSSTKIADFISSRWSQKYLRRALLRRRSWVGCAPVPEENTECRLSSRHLLVYPRLEFLTSQKIIWRWTHFRKLTHRKFWFIFHLRARTSRVQVVWLNKIPTLLHYIISHISSVQLSI